MKKIEVLCECNSTRCKKVINLSVAEMVQATEDVDHVIIANNCRKGPDKTDVLVEKRRGYSIYREEK